MRAYSLYVPLTGLPSLSDVAQRLPKLLENAEAALEARSKDVEVLRTRMTELRTREVQRLQLVAREREVEFTRTLCLRVRARLHERQCEAREQVVRCRVYTVDNVAKCADGSAQV